MSGIMLTLLGSTFGGAKNFIATFNDEDNARQTRSCAVCTDSNDNIYVSTAMFYDSGNSQFYQANFKVSKAGELKAAKGSRAGSTMLVPRLNNHVKSNGNYVYSFYSGSDKLLIHELSGDFSTTVSRKTGSTDNSSADFYNVDSCVWRPSNDHFYVAKWSSAGSSGQNELIHYNDSYSKQNARNYTFQQNSGTNGDRSFEAGGIAIDSSGNVYKGGSFAFTGYEGTMSKYNSSLTHQWTRSIRKGYGAGKIKAVAVDSNDNPYFCGHIDGDDCGFVTKYNSSGTQQWIKFLRDRDDSFAQFSSMHIDSNDNIYLGGSLSEDGYPNGAFYATQNIGIVVKYNTSGTKQWERGISYTNNATGFSNQQPGNMPSSITTDSQGNVIFLFAQHSNPAWYAGGADKISLRLAKIPADGSMTGTYSGGVDGNVKYGATDTTDTGLSPDYRTINLSSSSSINRYFINDTTQIDSVDYPTDIAEIS